MMFRRRCTRWLEVGAALQRLRGRLDRRERIAKIVNDHLHDPLVGPPGDSSAWARARCSDSTSSQTATLTKKKRTRSELTWNPDAGSVQKWPRARVLSATESRPGPKPPNQAASITVGRKTRWRLCCRPHSGSRARRPTTTSAISAGAPPYRFQIRRRGIGSGLEARPKTTVEVGFSQPNRLQPTEMRAIGRICASGASSWNERTGRFGVVGLDQAADVAADLGAGEQHGAADGARADRAARRRRRSRCESCGSSAR